MSAPKPQLLLPRHVRNLNALAESHGLAVTATVDEFDDKPGEYRLFVNWAGSCEQFFATSLISPHQQRRIALATQEYGLLVPCDSAWWQPALLDGRVLMAEGDARLIDIELSFGDVPSSIEQTGGVEVARCQSNTWFHGSESALVAAGVPPKRIPHGKRASRSSGPWDRGTKSGYARHWSCRRQPDGLFAYNEETELSFARREKEREALLQAAAQPSVAEPAPLSPEQQRQFDQGYATAMARRMVCTALTDPEFAGDVPLLRNLLRLAEERRDARALLERAQAEGLDLHETVGLLRRPMLMLVPAAGRRP